MSSINRASLSILLGKFNPKRKISSSAKFLLLMIFSFFIAISDFFEFSYLSDSKQILESLIFPLKHLTGNLMKIPQTVLQYVDIKKENASLRLEIDKLKIRAIVASGIEKEFEELKKSINFEYRSDPLKSIERILGFDKSIYNSYLLISVSQENTKEGAIVTVPQGLIGIITKKCKKFAKVLPITNSKILIPTKTDSGEHVILTGTDQNEMISNEIKSNTVTDLKIGEILSTSGEGGIYKKGIPVARITKIDKVKNQLMAKPLAKIDDLDFVSVANPVVQVQADVRERARS